MRSFFRALIVRSSIRLFCFAYSSRLKEFELSLKNPKLAQERVLRDVLARMEKTEFGRSHRIHTGMSRDEFRSRVPVCDYDRLEPWIQRQTESREPILTPTPIELFEKTSGSRGRAKWIPYNKPHLATFERMFVLWSLDLLQSGLRLECGKVYFLISPKVTRHERAASGVPVGLKDDSGYLGSFVSALSRFFFLNSSRDLTSPENFILDLSLSLLREPNLEVISVWSPSLLLLVTQFISRERSNLANCVGLRRATRLALKSQEQGASLHFRLWPKLKLISSWDAATAREDASEVQLLFAHARFQGKGLLATEAAMTVPWSPAKGHVPLLDDVYFEFEDERDGQVRELFELEVGATYRILVTAANGFLRYRVGDRVRVGRHYHETPTLEFLGRAGGISDLKGEKLSSEFVETCFEELFGNRRPFALVLPRKLNGETFYVLAIDNQSVDLQLLAEKFEQLLAKQHHYALARKLGQLQPVRAICLAELRETYFSFRTSHGAQPGQIKLETLIVDPRFSMALDGAMRRSISTSRQSRSESAARL
jgi:hypothetical protein